MPSSPGLCLRRLRTLAFDGIASDFATLQTIVTVHVDFGRNDLTPGWGGGRVGVSGRGDLQGRWGRMELTNRQIAARLRKISLVHGVGNGTDTACLVSATNLVRGAEFGDDFGCRVLREAAIRLNDATWPSDDDRTRALKPYVAKLLHARVTPALTKARGLRAVRMAVNVFAADALDAAAKTTGNAALSEHAAKLRADDLSDLKRTVQICREARDAAADASDAAYAYAAANAANASAYAYAASADAASDAADAYAYASAYASHAADAKRKNLMALLDAMLAVTE
jgi:hypothetical protein